MERRESVQALKEIAYRASQGTSFNPDRRGESYMDDLERDLQRYTAQLPEELHEHFEKRYIDLYRNWLAASSRCISSMITGPANFPIRRAEKLNNYERSAREKLDSWAERFIKKANRTARLTGWDEIARLEDKVERLTTLQETMKAANKICRSKKLSDVEKIDELVALGISEQNATTLIAPVERWQTIGFPSFALTNNLAKIKQAQERINRLSKLVNSDDKEIQLEGLVVKFCNNEERLRLVFEAKPDKAMIEKLKSNAFKWSPSNQAWQRQLTRNAIRAAEHILGVKFE